MSSVENWTKRDEWELSVLANDHSTPVIMHRANDHSTPVIMRRANDRPSVRSCAIRVHLTR
jgi:2,3-bisphosphoglycerate-independent phosphoglycerate mutase